jgi:hypothetical protein
LKIVRNMPNMTRNDRESAGLCYTTRTVNARQDGNLTYLRRPLGRPRRKWVDNIKIRDLREIGWDGVDWVSVTQDRNHWRAFVNTVMNLRVP